MLAEALARIPDDRSELRMRVELGLGEIAMRRGRPEIARSSVEHWLVWAREEGGPSDVSWALSSLASIYMREGDFAGSVALLDEALDAAPRDPVIRGCCRTSREISGTRCPRWAITSVPPSSAASRSS